MLPVEQTSTNLYNWFASDVDRFASDVDRLRTTPGALALPLTIPKAKAEPF